MTVAVSTPKARDLIIQYRTIVADIERGQAETPLLNHIDDIERKLGDHTFRFILLSVSVVALRAFLNYLLGESFAVISIKSAQWAPYYEVDLNAQEFCFQTATNKRQSFDTLASLLDAVSVHAEASRLGSTLGFDALRIGLPNADRLHGLHFAAIDDPDAIMRDPANLAVLAGNFDCVVLVGFDNDQPSSSIAPFLKAVSSLIHSLIPVVLQSGAETTAKGWWEGNLNLERSKCHSPFIVDLKAELISLFSDPKTPIREAILQRRATQELAMAVELLDDRISQEQRAVATRRAQEERLARQDSTPSDGTQSRRALDAVRTKIQDELSSLAKSAAENSKRSLLPDGKLAKVIDDLTGALKPENLSREDGVKTIRLRVADDFLYHVIRASKRAARKDFSEEFLRIKEALKKIVNAADVDAESYFGSRPNLNFVPAAEGNIWANLDDYLSFDIKYSGELPKRGFVSRLGEGRKYLYVLMMALSLGGTMLGFNWRAVGYFGPIFLTVFIGAVIYTYSAWRREDEETIAKEIDKVRDQLSAEIKRALSDFLREKGVKITEFLDATRKDIFTRIDEFARDRHTLEGRETLERRERARGRTKQLDVKTRELQSFMSRISRLKQDTHTLTSEAQRGLADSIRKPLVTA